MDDVLTMPRPAMRVRRPTLVPAVVIAVVMAVVFLLAGLALREPDTVRLTVDNRLDWRAEVAVRSGADPSWTGLGAVSRDARLDFQQVPDQGDEWIVRFSYAGYEDEVTVTRDALVSQGWTLEVPEALGERLAAAGVAHTTGSTSGTGPDEGAVTPG